MTSHLPSQPIKSFWSIFSNAKSRVLIIFCLLLFSNTLALAIPWGIKLILDNVLLQGKHHLLVPIILYLILIALLRALINFNKTLLSGVLGDSLVKELRERVFRHIQNLSLDRVNTLGPAYIFSRISFDINCLKRFLCNDGIEFIYALTSTTLIIFLLNIIHLKLTLIALLTLPLFGAVYLVFINRLKETHAQLRELNAKINGRLNEVLNGLKVIRASSQEKNEEGLFSGKLSEIFLKSKKTHTSHAWIWVGIEFFTTLGTLGVLWMGGRAVFLKEISIGELVAFYTYLGMLFAPMIRLVMINTSFQEAKAAIDRINQILIINDNVRVPANAITLPELKGNIEFRNVCFEYAENKPVLTDITFTVSAGEKVGIVGCSGSGKTTLINLLLRLYDPTEGGILVDGVNLKKIDLSTYRQQVAIVLQDDFLFDGSIEENIKYGAKHNSDQLMINAACQAQAHHFITSFKNEYQTRIGERGVRLSNGQRQRVCIARALMRRPSILILDEATSNVDAFTENAIQESVYRTLTNQTIFVVAHRFSTIINCDKIIVINDGKIVETGDHNYLLNKGGFYSTLYNEQFKEEDQIKTPL
jgi:ABC-type bacteriocin/lantibiotic exporter with double-glycine peptidase domain